MRACPAGAPVGGLASARSCRLQLWEIGPTPTTTALGEARSLRPGAATAGHARRCERGATAVSASPD
eukprot:13048222-Alexandrium_andersonii.AAC.1